MVSIIVIIIIIKICWIEAFIVDDAIFGVVVGFESSIDWAVRFDFGFFFVVSKSVC